jgi:hypothetical protein
MATTACAGGAADARRSTTHVDTLAGGVLSIRSDGPVWADSTAAWPLLEEVRYGGEEGSPGELVDPQSFAADDAGRLYVVDSKPSVVKVFAPDGSFLRTMGREGSGPGEFRVGFIATRGDRIALHDPQQGRTTAFDTSGTFIKSTVTFCCYWGDIAIDTAQRIVIPAFISGRVGESSTGTPYARYTLDLAPIDTFWVPNTLTQRLWTFTTRGPDGKERASMSMLIPFTPRVQHGLHPWGGVVRGVSDAYRIVRSPGGTDSTWVATRPWSGDPIPEERRVARVEEAVKSVAKSMGEERARQTARVEDVPATAPAFTRLAVDEDGNIWARQLLGSDSTQTVFDVLDARGAWLGTLRVPYGVEEYGGAFFGRGAIYLKTESDDGRPVIVRLRVR